ncbi:MAG: VCBS repeat-containing protein [Planctomycetota bacterium]
MRWLLGGSTVAALVVAFAFWPRPGEERPSDPDADASPAPAPFDIRKDEFELDPAILDYVWKIERRAHQLQHELAPLLEEDLKNSASTHWQRVIGAAPVETPAGAGALRDFGFARTVRWEKGETGTVEDLLAWLQVRLGQLAVRDRVHVHICNLSPRTYGELDGAFTGTWAIEIEGQGEAGNRLEIASRFAIDYRTVPDRSATAPGFVEGVRLVWLEERTAPHALLEEITDTSGVLPKMLRDTFEEKAATIFESTALLDYDRDGHIDLLVLDTSNVLLYRGKGDGTFEDRSLGSGLLTKPGRRRGHFRDVTVADIDNDGYPDLLFDYGRLVLLYRNLRDGTFRHDPAAVLPTPELGGATVFDYDGDGDVDLLVRLAGHAPKDQKQRGRWIGDWTGRPCVLLRNDGDGKFTNVTEEAGASAGHREIYGLAPGDFDGDGDVDVLAANHMGENAILRNDGDGTFTELPFARAFGGFSMGVAAGDLDGDGIPDAYVANMSSRAGQRIHQNLRTEDFPPGVHELVLGFFDGDEVLRTSTSLDMKVQGLFTNGWAYGPSMVDMDGDGRLDVYVPAGYQSVENYGPDG